jgi:hypothetical protein
VQLKTQLFCVRFKKWAKKDWPVQMMQLQTAQRCLI